MGPSPLTPEERAAYERELGPQRIRTAREFSVLASVLYALFGILDWWAIPSALLQVWTVRAVVVLWLLGLLAYTRSAHFLRHYVPVMVATFVVAGAGIELMILLAGPQDVARWLYYTGLILVTMGLYTFTFLPVAVLAVIGYGLVALYLAIAIGVQDMTRPGDWQALLANAFFLVSANVIGIIGAWQRQRLLLEGFRLRQRLRLDLQRTEEEKRQSGWLAAHDPLTGLANRAALMEQLHGWLGATHDASARLAVLFVDLDGFKQVNDRQGHLVGDEVLRVVARRLQRCVRERDLVARLGGDEFAILLMLDGGDAGAVARVVAAVQEACAQPIVEQGHSLTLGASVGVALAPDEGREAQQLLQLADARMYEAKARQRKQVAPAASPSGEVGKPPPLAQ